MVTAPSITTLRAESRKDCESPEPTAGDITALRRLLDPLTG
jgi:hypothetical protein